MALYDVVLAYRDGTVQAVVPPVRYFSERYSQGVGPGGDIGLMMIGNIKTLIHARRKAR